MQIAVDATAIRRRPAPDAPQETQALYGEIFDVYEERDGWAWGQAAFDGYVGYVERAALAAPVDAPTHRVCALRTYVFSDPDIKSAPQRLLSMNAKVAAGRADGRFLAAARGGWITADHLRPLSQHADDFVAVAEMFLHAPYFWGGRESLGLDCSALVQNALEAAGIAAPRDTDMQALALGAPVAGGFGEIALQRGDLVFWKGHVGIMLDAARMVHANATAMAVSIDDARAFAAKIEAREGPVTGVRRLPTLTARG